VRDQSNANRVQCEPNPDVGTERKEKEILVSSINEKKRNTCGSTSSRNNNNININLTLYEFGSRQTVLKIATK
jgi:hypothetical protein